MPRVEKLNMIEASAHMKLAVPELPPMEHIQAHSVKNAEPAVCAQQGVPVQKELIELPALVKLHEEAA
jgi:hypothetical protein